MRMDSHRLAQEMWDGGTRFRTSNGGIESFDTQIGQETNLVSCADNEGLFLPLGFNESAS